MAISAPGRRLSPGGRPETLSAVVFNLVGIATIVGSWVAISGDAGFASQLPVLNVGIAGLIMVAAANAVYVITYRRAIKARLARLRAMHSTAVEE